MLKIVMLDSYPYKKEDFAFLAQIGNSQIYEQTKAGDICQRIQDADIVLTNKTQLQEEHFKVASKLKYIGVIATGFNVVDIVKAREYNIVVTNIPAYGTNSVAQHTFAMILELINKVSEVNKSVHAGAWTEQWCIKGKAWNELAGKTMGIIGFGLIGKKVAQIADAFGMNLLVSSRKKITGEDKIKYVERDELFTQSDIISLHCPLTPDTKNLIGRRELHLMKKSAILVNVSRGGLIDEDALHDALVDHLIAGACLDVLAKEPPPAWHKLYSLATCIITPHVAWSSNEAISKVLEITQSNLRAYLNSTAQNVVN